MGHHYRHSMSVIIEPFLCHRVDVCFKMVLGLCTICFAYGPCRRCECRGGWYCSKACQTTDFDINRHKFVCRVNLHRCVVRSICCLLTHFELKGVVEAHILPFLRSKYRRLFLQNLSRSCRRFRALHDGRRFRAVPHQRI